MKLIITDTGDRSVGIDPVDWEIEVPFDKEGLFLTDEEFEKNLKFFKEQMIDTYQHYCQCKCVAQYDFEIEDECE